MMDCLGADSRSPGSTQGHPILIAQDSPSSAITLPSIFGQKFHYYNFNSYRVYTYAGLFISRILIGRATAIHN
jgi:hypothetical protein